MFATIIPISICSLRCNRFISDRGSCATEDYLNILQERSSRILECDHIFPISSQGRSYAFASLLHPRATLSSVDPFSFPSCCSSSCLKVGQAEAPYDMTHGVTTSASVGKKRKERSSGRGKHGGLFSSRRGYRPSGARSFGLYLKSRAEKKKRRPSPKCSRVAREWRASLS